MIVDKEDYLDNMENVLHGTGINEAKVWQTILLHILRKVSKKGISWCQTYKWPYGYAIGAKPLEPSL